MRCGYCEQKACRMMLFRLCSGRSSSANCYTHLVRGAVLSPTLIGSASTHSCSEVNAVDSVRRTCRGLTNYWKTPTLLCLKKSLLTVVTYCINFYRHFHRLHRTIVCVIELISSAYRTAQDALWIVTFLLGPCLKMFIDTSKRYPSLLNVTLFHSLITTLLNCLMSVFSLNSYCIVLYCIVLYSNWIPMGRRQRESPPTS